MTPSNKAVLRLAPHVWRSLQLSDFWYSNARWERKMHDAIKRANALVLFGDSQIQLWPMRRCFGRLPILNRGLSGDTARHALERFRETVLPIGPRALAIVLGTNDVANGRSAEQIAADLRQIAEAALMKKIRPSLCGLLPVSGHYKAQRPPKRIKETNGQIESVARKLGIFYLDWGTKLVNAQGELDPQFTYDGLHPTYRGYQKLTEAILEVFYCGSGAWSPGLPEVW